MASGIFSPGSLFLHFLVVQAVVVRGKLIFDNRQLLLLFFLTKQFVQNRGVRVRAPAAGFLLQVGYALGRESEGAALFGL
jgi:hypothetical protein